MLHVNGRLPPKYQWNFRNLKEPYIRQTYIMIDREKKNRNVYIPLLEIDTRRAVPRGSVAVWPRSRKKTVRTVVGNLLDTSNHWNVESLSLGDTALLGEPVEAACNNFFQPARTRLPSDWYNDRVRETTVTDRLFGTARFEALWTEVVYDFPGETLLGLSSTRRPVDAAKPEEG